MNQSGAESRMPILPQSPVPAIPYASAENVAMNSAVMVDSIQIPQANSRLGNELPGRLVALAIALLSLIAITITAYLAGIAMTSNIASASTTNSTAMPTLNQIVLLIAPNVDAVRITSSPRPP